jgi:hypothetical protein
MTPKSALSVNFAEIPTLEVRCSECTGTIVFPLPLPKQYLQKHLDCPSCGRRLWEDANDQTYVSVSEFARALSNLKIHPFRTVALGFTLTGLAESSAVGARS